MRCVKYGLKRPTLVSSLLTVVNVHVFLSATVMQKLHAHTAFINGIAIICAGARICPTFFKQSWQKLTVDELCKGDWRGPFGMSECSPTPTPAMPLASIEVLWSVGWKADDPCCVHSGAAREKGGKLPPLWVELCNICVLSLSWNFFVSHYKYIARPSSKEPHWYTDNTTGTGGLRTLDPL